ncbi:MAG: hypothetical protein WAL98_11210 [Desulfatiglandaceae bacterium]|jgi:hypothetical protein
MIVDDWGRDPGVQRMRSIFGKAEEAQSGFLGDSALSPFDKRLKDWRRESLRSFEHYWGRAVQRGSDLSDEEVAALYVACLALVIQKSGVKIPSSYGLKDEKIIRLMETDPE